MKFSIIIPVYKTKLASLKNCIESVINQSFTDIEIILVDDASPDKCGQVCDEYEMKDNRVHVIHQKANRGVSSARNTGIKYSSGDWIFFLDSDDWVDKNTCEIINSYLKKWDSEPDIIMFRFSRDYGGTVTEYQPAFDNETWFEGKYSIEELEKIALGTISKTTKGGSHRLDLVCGKIYKRDIINNNNLTFDNLVSREDCLFFLRALDCSERVIYIDNSLYHYMVNEEGTANGYRPDSIGEQREFLKKLYKFSAIKDNDYIKVVELQTISCSFTVLNCQIMHKNNKKSIISKHKECKKFFKTEPFHSAYKNVKIRELRPRYFITVMCIKFHLYYLVTFIGAMYNHLRKYRLI